jgi:hypothetical protein
MAVEPRDVTQVEFYINRRLLEIYQGVQCATANELDDKHGPIPDRDLTRPEIILQQLGLQVLLSLNSHIGSLKSNRPCLLKGDAAEHSSMLITRPP